MKMEKRVYRKPFMYRELFSPNFCTNTCANAMNVLFDEQSFVYDVFEDIISNGTYDYAYIDEQIAHYTEIPSEIYMTNEDHGRFFNNGVFKNIAAMGMNYYNKSTYNYNSRLYELYGVESTDGNVYYFISKPSLGEAKVHS